MCVCVGDRREGGHLCSETCITKGQSVGITRRDCIKGLTVEGSSLSLESVDDVEGSDSLSLCVLGVGDRVSDDV